MSEPLRKIWKFPLPIADVVRIQMPPDSQVLCVRVQNDQPYLWAVVTDRFDEKTETREFEIYGTGHDMHDGLKEYIGTFQMAGGSLVWHVFEVVK